MNREGKNGYLTLETKRVSSSNRLISARVIHSVLLI